MRAPKILAATFVAAIALTACGGGGDDGGDGGSSGGSSITVTAVDIAFEETSLSTSAGDITVQLNNNGAAVHNFVVEGQDGDNAVAEANGGESASGTINLAAGSYTYYCSITGHREAGMQGTLTVS